MGLFFGFFIALFGMIYALSVSTADTVATAKDKETFDEYRSGVESWESRVRDSKLEYRASHDDVMIAYEERDRVLAELFGKEKVEWFAKNAVGNGSESLNKLIYMVLRGKLPMKVAKHGLWFPLLSRHDLSVSEETELAEDCRKFALWVNQELRNHGIYERMYFGVEYASVYCPIHESKPTSGCSYSWAPMIRKSRIYADEEQMLKAKYIYDHPVTRNLK